MLAYLEIMTSKIQNQIMPLNKVQVFRLVPHSFIIIVVCFVSSTERWTPSFVPLLGYGPYFFLTILSVLKVPPILYISKSFRMWRVCLYDMILLLANKINRCAYHNIECYRIFDMLIYVFPEFDSNKWIPFSHKQYHFIHKCTIVIAYGTSQPWWKINF